MSSIYYTKKELNELYQELLENEHEALMDALLLLPAIPLPHMEFQMHISDIYVPKPMGELMFYASINYKGEPTNIPYMFFMTVPAHGYPVRLATNYCVTSIEHDIIAQSSEEIEKYIDKYITPFTDNVTNPLIGYGRCVSLQDYYEVYKYVENVIKMKKPWTYKRSVGFTQSPSNHKLINEMKFLRTWSRYMQIQTKKGDIIINLSKTQQAKLNETCQVDEC